MSELASNPTVVLFNSHLLPPSQTFIKALGDGLRQFHPCYVGSRRVEGLALPSDRTLVVNQGGYQGQAAEFLFKVSGIAPQLYQQVQQLKPKLIHAQFGLSGALALPLAEFLRVPLLVHFRGADATIAEEHARYLSLNHWIYFQRREKLKQKTRLFITVSQFIRQILLEQGFPEEKVIHHYQGVDVNRFKIDPAIAREDVVLFVGRLTEKKGCEYLIDAMEKVQAVLPEVELVMIGEGPLRERLEGLASQKLKRYQFLGLQSSQQVQQWMNRAKILMAPSVTAAQGDSEGLPNVVMEAQAMGLPVVSTVHAGIPEAVIPGETGFLAPERDVLALADYCLQLLQDPTLWQHFSDRGQVHMRQNFNRPIQTQRLESLYEAIVAEGHP